MGGEWRNGGTEDEERMKLAKQKGNRGSCAIKPITKCSNNNNGWYSFRRDGE